MTFEESMKELEEIVEKLESGDIPLDEAMKLFENGISCVNKCNKMLDNAEQKVVKIMKDENGKPTEENFLAEGQ